MTLRGAVGLVVLAALPAAALAAPPFQGPLVDARTSFDPFGSGKLGRFLRERVFSERAKTAIYDEAVNAFRTHYDDNGSWQGEYWGKTMLGTVATATLGNDSSLLAWAATNAVAFVDEFQRPDGYICSYSDENAIGPNPDGSERFCWNLWSRKYTLWALVETSRALERDPDAAALAPGAAERLLGAARRLMDHWIGQMEKGKVKIEQTGYFAGIPSMSVLKPLMLLYRRTGDRKYLDYARSIVAVWERGDGSMPALVTKALSGRPVSEWYPNPGWWAKAYEMMSCYEGLLDYADATGERRLVEAVRSFADLAEKYEGNPFGSVGYFDHFSAAKECPNATTEVCDVIHWMRLNHALFAATGDARCIDRIENAYLNGFLPAIFWDGTWACHATRSHGTRQFAAPHQVGMKFHQCCVDNAPRVPLDLYESAAATATNGTVLALLYFRGDYALGGGVRYRVPGDDLLAGRLRLAVESPEPRRVRFRAPSWAEDFRVDGRAATNGWVEAEAGAGATSFTATYRPRLRLHEWRTREGADPRAALFEQVKETPEMAGLARREGGVYLTYGPFLLAKSTLTGVSREECLNPPRRVHVGEKVSLRQPLGATSRSRLLKATFGEGEDAFSVMVTELQAHDTNDPEAAFSIWF